MLRPLGFFVWRGVGLSCFRAVWWVLYCALLALGALCLAQGPLSPCGVSGAWPRWPDPVSVLGLGRNPSLLFLPAFLLLLLASFASMPSSPMRAADYTLAVVMSGIRRICRRLQSRKSPCGSDVTTAVKMKK